MLSINRVSGLAVLPAAALAVGLAGTAEAQFDELYTFTSGNPPIGDGNVYPGSLNPARQAPGGGARPGTFPSSGLVDFFNLNGNPAFFDANNFVTRPANLIQNEAFWTDPKIGSFTDTSGNPFDIALMGFTIYDLEASQFGFDLAIASAAGTPLPSGLDFQIQTDTDLFGFGEIALTTDAGGFDGERFSPEQAGTFFTVGGRQGFEGRYRFDMSDLLGLLENDGGGGDFDGGFDDGSDDGLVPSDFGSLILFDIDLGPIATPGGTTQIAFDNVVLGAPDIFDEVEPVVLPPLPEVGPNRPQYANYDAAAAPDNPDGDNIDFDPAGFGDDFTQLTITTDAADMLPEVGAEAFTEGVKVIFSSDAPENGLSAHEVTHTVESPSGGGLSDLPEDSVEIGPSVKVTNVIRVAAEDGSSARAEGSSPVPQIIEIETQLGTDDSTAAEAARKEAEAQAFRQAVFDAAEKALGEVKRFEAVERSGEDPGEPFFVSTPGETAPLSLSTLSTEVSPEPMFYLGYSVSAYLSLKEALQEAIVLGDAGSTVTPVFGADGEIVTYSISTWLVTEESGFITPVLTNIPEPGTAGLLVAAGLMLRRRGR
ncbi:MAG: DUF4157 domain-containing protein [Planctomycetota bacterium]